jgi:hypothetical protein
MEKKILVSCECPKSAEPSNITAMTEAFFGLKAGTLSSKPEDNDVAWYDGDRTAADYADTEANVPDVQAT